MQFPVRPDAARVVASPPAPLAATLGGPAPGVSPPPEGPGEPPTAVASADPTVPGAQLTDRAAAVLAVASWHWPALPGTVTAAEPPAVATARLGAGPLPPPGTKTPVAAPESPPVPVPVALPEFPVRQVTETGLLRLVTAMLQSPVAPDAGTAVPGPPGPLAATLLAAGVLAGTWGPGTLVPSNVALGGDAGAPAPEPAAKGVDGVDGGGGGSS